MHLLKHFKELTVRPKNAQELKGLVLQLAIQGKLTAKWREKNPNTKPASELLKLIEKENTQLIKEKKLRKEKSLPPISEEEIPFNISETWVWTRLGEIGTTNVGLTYKPAHINDDGVPVLRSSNIQEGDLCLKDLVRVNTDYREKDIIKEGDLLICARNGSRRLVGKCTIIDQIDEVMVFGAFMAIFRSDFNPYLQLFIQSPQFRSKLDGVETTTINQITQGNLKETTVPLPPLEEQKAIVEIVKTLFKEVEHLQQLTVEGIRLKEKFVVSALNQLSTKNTKKEWAFLQGHFKNFFNETGNIEKLRGTILQLAVQGKLTADWRANNPDIEDASVLLKHIQKEKLKLIKDKIIKKEKPLSAITKDEIPYELPEGWVWCRFYDFCEKITQGPNPKYAGKTHENYRVLKTKDFYNNVIHYSKCDEVSPEIYHEWKRFELLTNDIIFGLVGKGSTGKCNIFHKQEGVNYIFTRATGLFRLLKGFNLDSTYSKIFLTSPIGFELIEGITEGSTGQLVIRTSEIKKLPFSFPPIEEQKVIVQKVNFLMGLCDTLEQQVQQSQEQSEQLMKSVLKEVFENKALEEETLPMAAEPEENYSKSSFDEIFKSLNYDHEVAAVVLLTQERFGFTYGKKYVHKIFSNIDFLHELPIFSELQFQEHGWGMYSPILQKTLENEIFITYQYLNNNKRTLRVKSEALSRIRKWINANENKQFVNQVKQMLNVYEQPLIDQKMDRIELLNTVLECMIVLKTENLIDIRAKMKNWKMFEGNYNTKAEKFSENETLHMIHFIKSICLK